MRKINQNFVLAFTLIVVAFSLLWYSVCCIVKQPVTSAGSAYGIFLNQIALADPTAVAFLIIVALTCLLGLSIVRDHFASKKIDFEEIAAEIKEKRK
ncbi:MAG: hypothetical protein V1672_05765 [Candidatus Diapherotrites archaeon]